MGQRDFSRMPLPHWGSNVNKLYAELAERELIAPSDDPKRLWRVAEGVAGVELSPADSPEAAAAKCLEALGVK